MTNNWYPGLLFSRRGEPKISIGVKNVIMTRGASRLIYSTSEKVESLPVLAVNSVKNVNGAGDSLIGGTIYGLLKQHDLKNSIKLGLAAAKLSVESDYSVSEQISPERIEDLNSNSNY